MKMTLSDRLNIVAILPNEGSFDKLIIAKDIRKKAEITQDDLTKFEITAENNTLRWNDQGAKASFDIDFTEAEKNLIAAELKKISDAEKLQSFHLSIYELFVMEKIENPTISSD